MNRYPPRALKKKQKKKTDFKEKLEWIALILTIITSILDLLNTLGD